MNTLQEILAQILAKAGYWLTQARHAERQGRTQTRNSHEREGHAYQVAAAIVFGGESVVSDPNFQILWKAYVDAIEEIPFHAHPSAWLDAARDVVISSWLGEID